MNEAIRSYRLRMLDLGLALAGILAALVLVVVPAPLGIAMVIGSLVGLILLIWPAAIPITLVLSVPVQDVVQLPLAGIGITATQLMLATAMFLLPIVLLVRRRLVHYPAIAVALTFFLLVQIASLAAAQNLLFGVATIYRWTAALLAFLATIHLVTTRRAVIVLGFGISAAAVAEVGFGTLQSALGLAPPSFAVASGIYRAYGTFGQPNPFAGYLEMTGLWLAALSLWAVRHAGGLLRRYRRERLRDLVSSAATRRRMLITAITAAWFGIGAFASFVGIVLSFSRGAWVGTLAGIGVFVLFAPRTVRRLSLVVALLVATVALAGGWQELPAAVRERAQQLITQSRPFDVRDVQLTSENWAVVERMVHWQAAWGMFLDHPWTGVGAGNFGVAFPEYSPHPLFRIARGHAHNYYLHVLAELGIPGLLAYAAVLTTGLTMLVRTLRRGRSSYDRLLALGALAATAAVMVHNLVENLHELHLSVHLFALWGLVWRAAAGWTRFGGDR